MKNKSLRKTLSKPGLLDVTRRCFERIDDTVSGRGFTLVDYLMSGLAVFSLKYDSLLQFDRAAHDERTIRANLNNLFGVKEVPSDSGLRKRLDDLDPRSLRPVFRKLFGTLQRGKGLEDYEYIDGHCLLSIDGTGFFSSPAVSCENCCVKNHRDGSKTFYHQMLCGALVHPERKEVFVLAPEPVVKTDGTKKNDSERNAARRFIADLRREHPHLKLIALEDGLASNPHFSQSGVRSKIFGVGSGFWLN